MVRRPSDEDIARQALEALLLGPSRLDDTHAGSSEVTARVTRPSSLTPPQRALRAALDRLVDCIRRDAEGIRANDLLVPWERFSGRRSPLADGQPAGPHEIVRRLIDEFVDQRLAALSDLPWTRTWVLRLIHEGLIAEGLGYQAQSLPISEGWSRVVTSVPPELFEQVGLPLHLVDLVSSRQEQRSLLLAAYEPSLREAFARDHTGPEGRRSYASWKRYSPFATDLLSRINAVLKITHPRRPHVSERRRQIEYDVDVWYRRRVCRQLFAAVASALAGKSPRRLGSDSPDVRSLQVAVQRAAALLAGASVIP
jgi:hypothetical protein